MLLGGLVNCQFWGFKLGGFALLLSKATINAIDKAYSAIVSEISGQLIYIKK